MASLMLRRLINSQTIFELERFKPILITSICGATRKVKMIDPKPGYPKNVASELLKHF
jgi:hypothetical protein